MLTRRLATAGAGMVLAIAAALAVPGTAHAASCQFGTCTGKYPEDEGCDSQATTLDSRTDAAGDKVELRYSAACGAAWSRVTIPFGSDPYIQATAYGWPCDVNAGQRCSKITEKGPNTDAYTQVWSPMISFTYWVQACSSPLLNGQVLCTGAH